MHLKLNSPEMIPLKDNSKSRMRQLVNDSCYLLRSISNEESCCVSFSGGKDSLVALDLAIRVGIEKAVFCNTTVGFGETERYLESIEAFYGIKIDVVKPPRNFFDLVYTIGLPSRRLRWCCEVLKFGPLATYVLKRGTTALITGLRKEESFQRRHYSSIDENPLIPAHQINPVINWTEEDIRRYISDFNLPLNPLYAMGFKRIGCWLCPYQSKSDWIMIEQQFPKKMVLLRNTIEKVLQKNGRLGVRDPKDYITNYGWVKNAHPQISKIMGSIEKQDGGLLVYLKRRGDTKKVQQLMQILSKEMTVTGNNIFIKSEELPSIRRLIEKAINCVGCGACLATCKHLALHLNNGQISVNISDCIRCRDCLNTGILRGACIRRNYAPIRLEVKSHTAQTDEFTLNVLSRMCNGENIGLIRTKKSLSEVKNMHILGKLFPLKNGFFLKNDGFTAVFRKKNQFLEILVKTRERELDKVLLSIRKFLFNNGEGVN